MMSNEQQQQQIKEKLWDNDENRIIQDNNEYTSTDIVHDYTYSNDPFFNKSDKQSKSETEKGSSKRKNNFSDGDTGVGHHHRDYITRTTFEIPMILSLIDDDDDVDGGYDDNNKEKENNKNKTIEKKAKTTVIQQKQGKGGSNLFVDKTESIRTNIYCTIPPTTTNQNFSASIGCSSIVKDSIGCVTGNMSLCYHNKLNSIIFPPLFEKKNSIPSSSSSYPIHYTIQTGIDIGDQDKVYIGGRIFTTTNNNISKTSSSGTSTSNRNPFSATCKSYSTSLMLYTRPYYFYEHQRSSSGGSGSGSSKLGVSLTSSQYWDVSTKKNKDNNNYGNNSNILQTRFTMDCNALLQNCYFTIISKTKTYLYNTFRFGLVRNGLTNKVNPQISFNINPKLTKYRTINMSLSWNGKSLFSSSSSSSSYWSFSILLNQFLSFNNINKSSFGIGIYHMKQKGLCWLLSWHRGDVTVRIPIQIVSSPATSSSIVVWNWLSYVIQVLYLSLASTAIQDIIAYRFNLLLTTTTTMKEKLSSEQQQQQKLHEINNEIILQRLQKQKNAANEQKLLMIRQARTNDKVERSKHPSRGGGLVIIDGTYSITNGDTYNVTTQLQFWINTQNSTLTLTNNSKKNLLGFYDISLSVPSQQKDNNSNEKRQRTGDNNRDDDDDEEEEIMSFGWINKNISSLWTSMRNFSLDSQKDGGRNKKNDNMKSINENEDNCGQPIIPMLTVRYQYLGKEYLIAVKDTDPLQLPSSDAILVTNEKN